MSLTFLIDIPKVIYDAPLSLKTWSKTSHLSSMTPTLFNSLPVRSFSIMRSVFPFQHLYVLQSPFKPFDYFIYVPLIPPGLILLTLQHNSLSTKPKTYFTLHNLLKSPSCLLFDQSTKSLGRIYVNERLSDYLT